MATKQLNQQFTHETNLWVDLVSPELCWPCSECRHVGGDQCSILARYLELWEGHYTVFKESEEELWKQNNLKMIYVPCDIGKYWNA
jgi:hypothetical protein